jgi:hypothetical protein
MAPLKSRPGRSEVGGSGGSHDLRRTVATMLAEMGIALDLVAAVVGHEAGGKETRTLVALICAGSSSSLGSAASSTAQLRKDCSRSQCLSLSFATVSAGCCRSAERSCARGSLLIFDQSPRAHINPPTMSYL